eukprot:602771-Pleurochrysis_carterae.AAC.2
MVGLARTARGGRGGKAFDMRMGTSHRCVSTAMVVQGHSLLWMKTKSPGLGCAGAGREAATSVSALGCGHEEADTASGAATGVVGVEAESSADAARASWLKSATEPTTTLRGVVVSKCAAYEADCHRS